jgi:hypothetical protein
LALSPESNWRTKRLGQEASKHDGGRLSNPLNLKAGQAGQPAQIRPTSGSQRLQKATQRIFSSPQKNIDPKSSISQHNFEPKSIFVTFL